MKKTILCLFLVLVMLFSAVPGISDTEEDAPPHKPGERVNFLVAGIDRRSNGKTTSGTMVHADTIIVISVDFENEKVDLISLPRDMFVRVPGHKGYYKLNCAFNVGGGMDDPDAGFRALADTAGEVLGGISIPYYIAVDLSSLEKLVDEIGGVDIDVEMTYTNAYGRHYDAGLQHLNGVGVVDYCRARKAATVGRNDIGRTNRQRQVMIALYKEVKNDGILSSLPAIISSFKKGIWTNITVSQMAALANFALQFDPDDVGLHSLPGQLKIHEGWAYHFLDQASRKELIMEVYGFEAIPYGISSENYANYLDTTGFRARKVIAQAEKAFDVLAAQVQSGTPMTEEQKKLYDEAYKAYCEAVEAADALDQFMIENCDGIPSEKKSEYNTLKDRVGSTQKACKQTTLALGKSVGLKDDDFQWGVWPSFNKDLDINEVIVDFN